MKTFYHEKSTGMQVSLLSPAMESMFERKLAKLDKFDDDLVCDVYLSLEGKKHIVKTVLKIRGKELVSKAESQDMYKNIDTCVNNLTTQVVKLKKDYSVNRRPDLEEGIVDEN